MGIKPIEILAKSSSSDAVYAIRCYLESNKLSLFFPARLVIIE